ncbi:hypothetical protein [Nocardioides soli]|uniref:Uncharacterized protein n=1 Tax=Nocardioides soli TaxID=1036020 RepID=A0A7W4YZV8_9ACTN|nr:hypothetical protein [Nocardioides soli]MBB3041163.1 hypothetical protein [Nocardioides soli]
MTESSQGGSRVGKPAQPQTTDHIAGADNMVEPDAWLHSAPVGRITVAREMGVQYLAFCGRWAWPKPRAVIRIRTAADTADVCPNCRPSVIARLEAQA